MRLFQAPWALRQLTMVGLLLVVTICPVSAAEPTGGQPTVGQIERLDPRLDALVPAGAQIEVLAMGFDWSEGPVWTGDGAGGLPADLSFVIEYGIPHVSEELKPFKPNRLAAIKATWENCKAFDAKSRYEARPNQAPSFNSLQRFLAHTVHTPKTSISVEWHSTGESNLAEIVSEVEKGLEKDDDIIQQWFSGEQVMTLLRSANTFEEMVDRVRCVCSEFEADQRLQKIVESILGPEAA